MQSYLQLKVGFNTMEKMYGNLNHTAINFFNASYLPENFNPATDTLVLSDNGLIWTHYYTINEIIDQLVPIFLIFLVLTIYISHIYIAPKIINYLKSYKNGRNVNENKY